VVDRADAVREEIMTGNAFKSDTTVGPGVPGPDSFDDLVATDFWDNPLDDEDWKAPEPG
jgi:hypothetical protein